MTYTCLIKLRTNALWAVEMWNAAGINSEALRYYRILNYIENRMLNFK